LLHVSERFYERLPFWGSFLIQQTIMALTKTQKEETINELRTKLADAKTLVFVNFKGLTVGETNAFRKSLREAGVGYKVAKKTLIGRVLDEKGLTGELPKLDGEIGVAYSTDVLASAREVFNFAKGKERPSIAGGVFEGAYADKAGILAIATIPPREVLLSQIAYLLKSPIQRLAIAVGQVAEKKVA
jgi:large subunit ribosomal protein L10